MGAMMIRIGCAGWSLPAGGAQDASDVTQLARYAGVFNAAEIDAGFRRPPPRSTYERWASVVPADFRFAVVAPRTVTHGTSLADAQGLEAFLEQVEGLGSRLGTLVLRLPAAQAFDPGVAARFLEDLRAGFDGGVVVEPGHPGWFSHAADVMLAELKIARAGMDPAPVTLGHEPAGWPGTVYYRLHGTPGAGALYDSRFLGAMSQQLARHAADGAYAWCIFDDTARAGALPNALQMLRLAEGLAPEIRAA